MEKLLFQDALVAGKASLQNKKQISRCSSGQNGQSVGSDPDNGPGHPLADTGSREGDSFWTRDIGGNRVNLKNLSILCNQIAITLRAGVPIARCLDMSGAAEFANTMSMLLSSGLNVDRAIDFMAKTLNNSVLRKETESMIARIEEGHLLGECIRDCKNYPRTLQEMCAMGEETGELDSSLKVIGDFYTNEADTATKDALAKLEPTMLVLLAVFAGFIVISIYLPMFTMYNLM